MAQVPGSFASVLLFLLVPKALDKKGPKSGMTYLIIGILKNSCEPVWASLVAGMVKRLPAVQETQFPFLG